MSNLNSSGKDFSQDEIDLAEIVNQLSGFFNRYSKLIVGAAIAGVLLGLLAFYVLPRRYNVKMIADTRLLSSQEVIGIIERWNELLNNKEYRLLAQKMNVSPQLISNIHSIEAESGDVIVRPNQDTDPFIVTATIYDNNLVDSLQEGIANYLENSEYMRRRFESDRKRLQLLGERIKLEIAQLDTVKLNVQQLIKRPQNSASTLITDPGNVNIRQLDLYNRLLEVNQELEFLKNVHVIVPFEKAEHQDFPKLPNCLVVGGVMGLFAGLLLSFFRIILKPIPSSLV